MDTKLKVEFSWDCKPRYWQAIPIMINLDVELKCMVGGIEQQSHEGASG